MRKFLVSVALLGIVGAACAPQESDTSAPGGTSTDTTSPTADPCAVESLSLFEDGTLTIATGNPAYAPWYGGTSYRGLRMGVERLHG